MRRKLFLVMVILFVGIQFIPVSRTNPSTGAEFVADDNVKRILEKSCYDCHSNETRWPWYSHVAPASWLVAHDVKEGREHLNFSEWDKYSAKDQAHKLEEIREEVESGGMPLKKYLFLHAGAKLTDAEVEQLKKWSLAPPNPAPQTSLVK